MQSIRSTIAEGSNALCVLPTGTGKTEIMMEVIYKYQQEYQDIKMLCLQRNIELVDQTATRFEKYGIKGVGVFCASLESWMLTPVTVATIQSIKNINTGAINLLIIDEIHNYKHNDGTYFNFIQKLKEIRPQMKIIGFSATPFNEAGYVYGKDKLFPKITYTKKLSYMIEKGYLVKPILKSVEHKFNTDGIRITMGDYNIKELEALCEDANKIVEQVKDALPRLSGRKKIVWFCVSIAHAEMLSKVLDDCCVIHSKQKKDTRDNNFLTFKNTFEIRNMINVSVLKEGVDIPYIDAIVLMRPTRSANFYLQSCGRGLRLAPDKKDCLILDYGNIIPALGTLDDPVLNFKRKGKKTEKETEPVKVCPKCYSYVNIKLQWCPDCGFEFPATINIAKTTKTATEDWSNQQTRIMNVDKINLFDHVSKAGNDCKVIEYVNTAALWDNTHREYYTDKSMQWYHNRLQEIDDQLPFSIELCRDGKYWRIKKIHYRVLKKEDIEEDITL